MSPEFCEKENGFLDLPGHIFGQSPALDLPKLNNIWGEELSRTLGAPVIGAPMVASSSGHDI